MPLSQNWTPFLRKIFFFSGFTEEELRRLLEKIQALSLPKGATLFHQGDEGDALYLIRSGKILISKTEKHQEKTLAYLGQGDVLGEMCLLTGEPRLVTAVVDSTVELLVLYKKDFDVLLKELSTMAIHISRILSSRLLETTKTKTAPAAPSSKIYSLASFLPLSDRLVFTANLAVAMAEQSRRRVLLLDILDEESGLLTKALGEQPVRIGEASLQQKDLQSPDILQKLASHHSSGLELISLPLPIMAGKLFSALYPFLTVLRQNYDFILIVLPLNHIKIIRPIIEESDKLIFYEKEAPAAIPADIMPPPRKIFHIVFTQGTASAKASTAHFRLPWNSSLINQTAQNRTTLLPAHDHPARRLMNRLARELTGFRIGFAMGSGAALGYSIIGILRVMERHGIYPDILAGTSMGALMGSFYALGKTPDEMDHIARTITKKKLMHLADFTLPWQGLILGRNVHKFLKSILGDITFDGLPNPFACVATDIMTGEEIILKQGRVADAVRASLSLPFFFQPFFLNEHFLVDGGLVNPVPTSLIASMGADILISANLTTKPGEKRFTSRANRRRYSSYYWKGPHILEVLFKTIYTMQFGISQTRAEPAHMVLAPDLSEFTWSEFHRAPEIIKAGEEYAEEAIVKIKSLIPYFSKTSSRL